MPLDLKVHATVKRDGYEIRVISFAGAAHYRVPAFLLVPSGGAARRPAVVALHDHGGWFFHGKEKLVRMDGEHVALTGFRRFVNCPDRGGNSTRHSSRSQRPCGVSPRGRP